MAIEIRTVMPIDYEQLVELMGDLGYPTTFEKLMKRFEVIEKHEDYKALVAVEGNNVVGFAGMCKALAFEFDGIYVRLLAFVVKSNQREKGVGKMLLNACEQWAIEIGAKTITLNSGNREEREVAHLFYKRNGFEGKSTGFIKKLN
ncbi:GNAT family N-acetyltransferase [Ureibacillus sp. 179-F W5.1 NHS]|nr:GNAT family N-acetyltransferase [Lysinibacillus halotolerans]